MNFGQNFCGRGSVLELLKKRVIGLKEGYRQNVALLGARYVGKTSILRNFLAGLEEENVVTVYLDLENKDFDYFLTQFTTGLLYSYSQNAKLPLHDDVRLLLESTKKFIPHTVQVIKKIYKDYQGKKTLTSFLGLLTLPEVFTNETGQSCVLVWDEFQDLEGLGIPHAFQHLGKKIMTQKRCLYVAASSYPQLARKILSEKLSLLFGNFETVDVEPFDFRTSREFICARLGTLKMAEPLCHFLIDFTGGYPLYLNLICQELVNAGAVHKQGEIFIPLFTQAVENTLFHPWGLINRHFELMTQEFCSPKGGQVVASLLISLAKGKQKIDDLRADCGITKNQALQKIHRLMEAGVVIKNGSVYYFKDKLFKYWVQYILQSRLRDVAPDVRKQSSRFQAEFHRAIESFQIDSRKDFSCRIVELLHCFDNEAFDLNGRRYKLPLFQKIIPLKLKNERGEDFSVIRACAADSTWVIVLKNDNFGEAEVHTVMAESARLADKSRRHLIISLKDLDENTRLRALQEKFWIWNEREVKALLTLFDKPYIAQ